jgi:hypothetical protein
VQAVVSLRVTGLEAALRRVRNAPRQVRFASAVAANKVAEIVQRDVITSLLPRAFTLRSRGAPWWKPGTRFGFNIRFARRTDPEPTARIGSRADWLYLQEEGGTKTAGGRTLAIPQLGTARPQRGAVIPSRSKPSRILKQKRAFIAMGTRGRVILTRRGKRRYPVKFWYAFEHSAQIKPVLRFGPTESALARRHLSNEFNRAMRMALSTAK